MSSAVWLTSLWIPFFSQKINRVEKESSWVQKIVLWKSIAKVLKTDWKSKVNILMGKKGQINPLLPRAIGNWSQLQFWCKKHCNRINFLIPNLVERKAHKLIASLGRSSIITAYLRKNIEQINYKRFIALGVWGGWNMSKWNRDFTASAICRNE